MIIRVLKDYVSILRTYKELVILIVLFSMITTCLEFIIFFSNTLYIKYIALILIFFMTGFFISLFSSLPVLFYTTIKRDPSISNFISGFLFMMEAIVIILATVLNSYILSLISIILFIILLYSIIILSTEDVSLGESFKIFFSFLKRRFHLFLASLFLLFVFYVFYRLSFMALNQVFGKLDIADTILLYFFVFTFWNFVASILIIYISILYLLRYSAFRSFLSRREYVKRGSG